MTQTYTGSCHCGFIRYVVRITLPPKNIEVKDRPRSEDVGVRIYKCNCSTCMKMNLLHLRPSHSPSDFAVLTPLTVEDGSTLGDYLVFKRKHHWYFCRECGVHCFAFGSPDGTGSPHGEIVTVTRTSLGLTPPEGDVEVWRPKEAGWDEGRKGYLSINATTLDADQAGLDLREWHEKKWIAYVDCKDGVGMLREGEPHQGGVY
ncbi:hypothetical protein K470DRAFT_9674 [Piedraia hortae CBS 480.64]|uniref:CENP-V/GFA domain-containing protein n=1 Tax=Piedraia hortae CBS 480.64 TaxID=1314780 RepID=A0A6A7C4F4_9PEZI|nr:hypothetical protein K470DRAFT_9674 [Piedraia hortae CBS 480.64]